MKIYADTSGPFAALVRNDDQHPVAKDTLTALLEGDCEIHTTSYVVVETLALLQARVGLRAGCQFEQVLRPLLRVTWIEETLHDRAFHRLELRGSRKLSLVDCSGFVLMEELGIEAAFGYDDDFISEGFRLVGHPEEVPT